MSEAPWHRAKSLFVGWVPNVLGHISFSLIGRNTRPVAHCASAQNESSHQCVVAHQKRQSDDYALHRWITAWTRPKSIHDWILIANTDEISYPSAKNIPAVDPENDICRDPRGMLVGTIFCLIGDPWRATGFFGQFGFRIRRFLLRWSIRRIIRRASRTDGKHDAGKAALSARLDRARASGFRFGEIFVSLVRTGEARFWTADEALIDDHWTEVQLACIAYFFIKDIAHLHTHHHVSQDGMVPFHEIGEGGERDWQRQTLWALSRSIEENVRSMSRESLRSAIGIIPYAENFHSLYSGMIRKPGKLHEFERIPDHELDHYSFEPLRKLIAVTLESNTWNLGLRTAKIAAFFPITLSCVIAINALGSSRGNHTQWPGFLHKVAENNPATLVLSILATLWLAFRLAYKQHDTSDPWLFAFYRTFTRATKSVLVTFTRWFGVPYWMSVVLLITIQGLVLWSISLAMAFVLARAEPWGQWLIDHWLMIEHWVQ